MFGAVNVLAAMSLYFTKAAMSITESIKFIYLNK